jgi:hypothetical protein
MARHSSDRVDQVNKAELIEAARAQWAKTEEAITAAGKGKFDGEAATTIRNLLGFVHNINDAIDEIVNGQPITSLKKGDTDGSTRYAALQPNMLRIEMNTAHGIVWMAIQKFNDTSLKQKITWEGQEMTVAEFLEEATIKHEQAEIEKALKAAGVAVAA